MSDMNGIAGWVALVGGALYGGSQVWKAFKGGLASLHRGARVWDIMMGEPARADGTPARIGMIDRWGAVEETLTALRGLPAELATVRTELADVSTLVATVRTELAEVQGLAPRLAAVEQSGQAIEAMATRIEAIEAHLGLQVQPASAVPAQPVARVYPSAFRAYYNLTPWYGQSV